MAGPELIQRSRALAKIALVSAVGLVVVALLLPLYVDHASVPGGVLVLWGLFLLLAAIILGVALSYVFMTRGLQAGPEGRPPAGAPSGPSPRGEAPEAALRLLTGDERALYRRVVAAGGAVLQKDLVGAGLFTGPKITRILDRLEAKGLISRERYGMTNRIRLSEAWREEP
jgi:uncharacterized membrane protein